MNSRYIRSGIYPRPRKKIDRKDRRYQAMSDNIALRWQVPHGIAGGSVTGSRHALSFVRVVGGEVGVALGFFVVELRQELRRGALRPPRARKQWTSKYIRWSGVFIYRTVESVRRHSHRHRNSAIRPTR